MSFCQMLAGPVYMLWLHLWDKKHIICIRPMHPFIQHQCYQSVWFNKRICHIVLTFTWRHGIPLNSFTYFCASWGYLLTARVFRIALITEDFIFIVLNVITNNKTIVNGRRCTFYFWLKINRSMNLTKLVVQQKGKSAWMISDCTHQLATFQDVETSYCHYTYVHMKAWETS